ncbi:MAG: polyphosphate polymerase domain-containing protein [Candidatus Delongbacteria bacterium]|jgi:SPX domain protein involved in polyphosphate accumulation|nr:polyphosphate polymerase domain-containing protein [Candidatus Delongbacteria bacterium]
MRYERKIPINGYSANQVENLIKLHPQCFKEIFFERRINNIYFDDLNNSALNDNIDGRDRRVKYRLRWYGEHFGIIEPTLELKIKIGPVGYKRSFKLGKVFLPKDFQSSFIKSYILNSEIPKDVLEGIVNSNPVLFNSYRRKYFLSFDNKFRITLDKNIEYAKIEKGLSFRNNFGEDLLVVEIKYDSEDEQKASNVINHFPFRIDKNSKFVNGVIQVQY